jgi:inward rectifier potassium channel
MDSNSNNPPSNFPRGRILPRNGRFRAIYLGGRNRGWWEDLYVRLIDAKWRYLFAGIALLYLIINLVFATAYLALGDGIENARPGSFTDTFFFSVQTMATIGYGKLVPNSILANILVTVEAFSGFVYFAIVTGLMFSKFSRPTARVLFSEKAVICPYNGVPHLMLRMANQRGNRIVDAKVQLVVLLDEVTAEGHDMRRFHDLKLVREKIPMMQLTWTVMHPLDETSPLYHACDESLHDRNAEVVVSLTGLDETLSQTIHARYSYIPEEIACDSMFVDILNRTDKGVEVDYRRFHDVKVL